MQEALQILDDLGTPCLLCQPRYNLLEREAEWNLFALLEREGVGCAVYSPLAQGLLTSRYLGQIPDDSRAADPEGYLSVDEVVERRAVIQRLNEVANGRNQTLAQMALAWVLRRPEVTTAIVGASRVEQLEQNVAALAAPPLTEEDLTAIDQAMGSTP